LSSPQSSDWQRCKCHASCVGIIGYADSFSGSLATIIRLPYTHTLTPYKGDFLYRTTDFAIWSTVEIGVGITAGCIATLKPLLKSSLLTSMTGRSTPNPYSKASGSKFGSKPGVQPLDDLRPKPGKSVTVTTVTGGRGSSESDEENILDTGIPSERWDTGINKSVTTTIVEQRASHLTSERRQDKPKDRTRSCSAGGDSESTLGDEDRARPVRAYERF